jgi:hypothetical protein
VSKLRTETAQITFIGALEQGEISLLLATANK